ncbi:MAG: hypothetical protein QNL33_00970 [Akkermansiaceae bacterium]|jgi:hypothetical protein
MRCFLAVIFGILIQPNFAERPDISNLLKMREWASCLPVEIVRIEVRDELHKTRLFGAKYDVTKAQKIKESERTLITKGLAGDDPLVFGQFHPWGGPKPIHF